MTRAKAKSGGGENSQADFETRAAELQKRIGFAFKDRKLLKQALTHSSAAKAKRSDNERLEFLGDRVLGLVIAEELSRRFTESDEGGLSRRLNALVRKETCAEIARTLDIGSAMRMDKAEARSGGREKMAIIADACEAVIAAIYLDGGLDAARKFILTHWKTAIGQVADLPEDPKTTLQEWAHQTLKVTPTYELLERKGPDHAPRFVVAVKAGKLKRAKGAGKSKREAEQAAATAMLVREGVWKER